MMFGLTIFHTQRRESTAFQELESKLLLAQEQQRQETRKHFKNQEEFQEYMRNLMEEQSKSQMVVRKVKICTNT